MRVLALLRRNQHPPSLAQATAVEAGEEVLSLLQPKRASLAPHFIGGPLAGMILVVGGVLGQQWAAVVLGVILATVVPVLAAYDWAATELVATRSGLYVRSGLHGQDVRRIHWKEIHGVEVEAQSLGNLWTITLVDDTIKLGGMPGDETLPDALESHWLPVMQERAVEDAKMADL
jgi:hypothetical protein